MKKYITIIIVTMLCIGIFGCGMKAKSQFDEASNQQVNVFGLNIQIPKAWQKTYDYTNYFEFNEPQNNGNYINSLVLGCDSDGNLDSSLKWARKSIDDYKETSSTIANVPAHIFEFKDERDGKQVNIRLVLLQTNHGVVNIVFYSMTEVGYDDFEKVVNSITLNIE